MIYIATRPSYGPLHTAKTAIAIYHVLAQPTRNGHQQITCPERLILVGSVGTVGIVDTGYAVFAVAVAVAVPFISAVQVPPGLQLPTPSASYRSLT